MIADLVPAGFTIGAQVATLACVLIVGVGGLVVKLMQSQNARIRQITDEQTKLITTNLSDLGRKVDKLAIGQAVHTQQISAIEDETRQKSLAAALVSRVRRAEADHGHEDE